MRYILFFALAICSVSMIVSTDIEAVSGVDPEWVSGQYSAARLIPGTVSEEGGHRSIIVGVQVKLVEGWKTYWRVPGDSGVPPVFDWSGSENLGKAKVFYPAPKRYADPYGQVIGYEDQVVFPVLVIPENDHRPVDLKLNLAYGICKDICVPAEAKLSLSVAPDLQTNSAEGELVEQYLRKVPKPVEAASKERPAISDVKLHLKDGKPFLLVEAAFPEASENRDLFVETSVDFYLPLPEVIGSGLGNVEQFKIDLSRGDDPESLRGKTLTLTLVSSKGGTVTSWTVQ